jgi:hypothetical protein
MPADLPLMDSADNGRSERSSASPGSKGDEPDPAELAEVTAVGPTKWFELSRWGKETEALQPWQRALAFSLGRLLHNGKRPSAKQAHQGSRILGIARERGFLFT